MWLAAVLGLTTVALLGIVARTGDVPAERVAFSVFPPTDTIFLTPLGSGSAAPVGGAISPDGRLLAFTATDKAAKGLLWVRPLDSLTATALPGTEGAALPFWSPDSKSLAFFAPGKLKRIDIANRGIQNLADITRGSGGTWGRDGVIVFAANLAGPLHRVSAAGGDSSPATTLSTGHRSHRFPHFLPDGRHFLYYVEGSGADDSGVFVGELDAHNDRRILAANSAAVYARSGHVLFVREGSLYAQPFDPSTLQVTGNPAAIAASIPSQSASPAFSASNTGVVTYLSGVEHQQYAWFDRRGSLIEAVGQPGHYRGIDLASDGRVAVHRHNDDGGDVWLWDQRGSETRVTLDATLDNSSPTFSPDGSRIAFSSLRKGKWGLYQKRSDGTGPEELIVESDLAKSPADWTPDGKYILYWLLRQGLGDVWQAPVTGGDGARPLLDGPFYEGHAQVSPEGRWVAYASGRSGQSAIYVRPFPSGEGEWKVSSGGGVTPRWRGDGGKELFYVTSYNEGTLMAVSYRIDGHTFVPLKEEELFPVGMVTPPHSTTINVYHTYVVSPDGARFLIPRPVSRLKAGTPTTPITVHTNWTAMLAP
jgi:Tol biopolymer transport system component